MKNLKTQLMLGHTLEFSNDVDLVHVWHSRTTNSFCIQLNAVVIDSLKTFKIFEMKLQNLLKKREIEFQPKYSQNTMKKQTLKYLYLLSDEYEKGITQIEIEIENSILNEKEISALQIELTDMREKLSEVKESILWVQKKCK